MPALRDAYRNVRRPFLRIARHRRLAPTAYGRVGLALTSSIATRRHVHAKLTLPSAWAHSGGGGGGGAAPRGGLRLRLRPPGEHRTLCAVRVGGRVWTGFNATASTVDVPASSLSADDVLRRLEDVWATFC